MNLHCFIVELQQGTPEWREWRHKGIGSSDACVILGDNRFKSVAELLREKRAPARDFGCNEAMARGIEDEPQARRQYAVRTGRTVGPVCLQSKRYEWLRASLDGFASTHDAVVEIKCGHKNYLGVSRYDRIPTWHRGQLQHILAVTGFDCVDFFSYSRNCNGILLTEIRDDAYIERLLDRELEFWNQIQQAG
jgi:putative phage-type endonuclease